MSESAHRIVRAWLESPATGIIELDRDWKAKRPPRFSLGLQCPAPSGLAPAPGLPAARSCGYFFDESRTNISFVLPLEHLPDVDPSRDKIYLAGDFNGWDAAVGVEEWRMRLTVLEGERVLIWTGEAVRFLTQPGLRFKFVTGEHQWLVPPEDATNIVSDGSGNRNRVLDPARTGWHLWRFTLSEPLSLAESCIVSWAKEDAPSGIPLLFGNFFFELKSSLPLGALVEGGATIFRIFAPRARSVTLLLSRDLNAPAAAQMYTLARRADADGVAGIWEVTLLLHLHGWYYWYSIEGPLEGPAREGFDPKMRVLDPYALATIGRDGPGIVLDREWLRRRDHGFVTPLWQNLIMVEAHVRDLTANAPITATFEERRGFTGLRKWVESPDFYLHHLGVNCVELQPVQEFDNTTTEEYHWGYMTNNFFAPESSYSLEPERASGVHELQELVAAFHRRGMAVVLDVVYNHVGVPAHLMFIDRLYYFEQDASGALSNWSGCGNDLRAHSAMALRLIIDSCRHFLEVYAVDGFRFDLAELLGVAVLREIEVALKRTKPDVILIAEPWSFRGHIAGTLRDTGWASWNDGYRKFVRDYLCGRGDAERMEYFLRGSPWYFAKWPSQTINYTESHDDRTWLDDITSNANYDGSNPSGVDKQRTHLMAALLFMSLGVPMLSSGQDFLRSKRGVTNTYQRGDINALNYRQIHRHPGTHGYFADWIAFRRSPAGRLLRQWSPPSEGFFRFVRTTNSAALAVVYNADGSDGPERLLFAVNPAHHDVIISLDEEILMLGVGGWKQVANHEEFVVPSRRGVTEKVERELFVPSLGCGLWISGSWLYQ